MLIRELVGNLSSFDVKNRLLELVELEWFETDKRILNKKSSSGESISLKFLGEQHRFKEGDILFEDENRVISITIKECDVLIIRPKTMFEVASICYEIGNKHLPLFYQNEELLVAFDASLFKLLSAAGYDLKKERKQLANPLKTSVSPHGGHNSGSLFSTIMKMTASPE